MNGMNRLEPAFRRRARSAEALISGAWMRNAEWGAEVQDQAQEEVPVAEGVVVREVAEAEVEAGVEVEAEARAEVRARAVVPAEIVRRRESVICIMQANRRRESCQGVTGQDRREWDR